MKMTGAQIVIQSLIDHDVDSVFGFPGGSVIFLYDALYQYGDKINHYLTSHEQGAAHAADGYARVTGKPGVCMATSGPGATNLVTGIATAFNDSVPMVAITGNVPWALMGRDSFQEVDICGVTMPITKHNYIVRDICNLENTIKTAFKLAVSGRPGPVLIDIPKDIQTDTYEYVGVTKKEKIIEEVSQEEINTAIELIRNAKRPFVYAGGGVVCADAYEELLTFLDKADLPIGTSMMGLSGIDNKHPRFLGMVGMHGDFAATSAMSNADLIIALGTRFSDRVVGNKKAFAMNKKVLHIDVDPAEISKNLPAFFSITGDLKDVLSKINASLDQHDNKEWNDNVHSVQDYKTWQEREDDGLTPKAVIDGVCERVPETTVIATDVGQHQMWTAQYYKFSKPRTFLTSGGLGTMGYGLGAAIGGCVGNNKQKTILFTGDGSFHMNLNELATCVQYNLDIIVIVLNNNTLGMVRQWQTIFFDKRYSETTLNRKTDFVKLAEAFGAKGFRAYRTGELNDILDKAMQIKGPVLIDAMIDIDERVLPMIPPGGTIDDIIVK